METKALLYTTSAFIFSLVIILKFLSKSRAKNLPPLVPGWLPVIGHVHRLSNLLHRVLHDFSLKVGPIFSLRLGSKLVVVVSSSALVDECFNKNDVIFANRPVASVDRRSVGFSTTTIIGAQYGDHWRNMRKLCDLEVFASAKLASFLSIRREEMDYMISSLYKMSATGFMKVNVEEKIVELTFNNIMRMIDGKRYYGEEVEEDEETKNFRNLTKEALELTNADNPGEIFPMLKWIGCNGVEKKLAQHRKKTDEFMQALLDEHRQGPRGNTVIDHLLNLQESQPDYYTDEIITGLIVAIIIAGTDASVVATEWVMTQLLNHPEAMNKAREEIDSVVGHDRLIEEHDLPKLRYLHYIILETLRLFPSVPLLVPHATSRDCKIGGYDIPKGTMILVNAWAIHRDPKVWDEPLRFMPERFEKIEVETHKLLPFGMGKRACPGAGLAQKYIGLAVGSLIQCFDWKRTSAEKIDVSEGPGSILVKRNTLEGMCKTRGVMENVVRGISRV